MVSIVWNCVGNAMTASRSVGSLVRLLNFAEGEAGLVEVTLADHSPAVGVSLINLDLPRDASIVAVVRGRHVVVPRGDTVLQRNDEVRQKAG